MYFKRHIDNILIEWKNEPKRKPLFLRGARQVGKSSAVRELAKHFDYYIEINFEELKSAFRLFDGDLSPHEICENIAITYNIPVIEGRTLLFFDEIQMCLPAISSLRYFYEKKPNLHVVAAGSLLEFAIEQLPSFGVGRVRSIFMYPFSFNEYLEALNLNKLLEAKKNASFNNPLPIIIHQKLIELFRKFLIIGGMPEVVSHYCEFSNMLECNKILDDLLLSLKSDFSKYRKRFNAVTIGEVYKAISIQAGGKFIHSKASEILSLYSVKESVELLKMAGLIIPVTHTSANGLPLGAEKDLKKQKLLYNDTGLFQREAGLNLSDILLENNFKSVNKGAIAESAVGLELIKYAYCNQPAELFYWHRETPGSNAEVDYVIQLGKSIVPVEVKAPLKGSMQSLRQFINLKKCDFGIRISEENFGTYDNIRAYPIYAVSEIFLDLN